MPGKSRASGADLRRGRGLEKQRTAVAEAVSSVSGQRFVPLRRGVDDEQCAATDTAATGCGPSEGGLLRFSLSLSCSHSDDSTIPPLVGECE